MRGMLTCLHSEFLVCGSLSLADPVVLYRNGEWDSYINTQKEEKCLDKGLEVYGSEEKYLEYANNFRKYIQMANMKLIPKFSDISNKMTVSEFEDLLPTLQKFWYYYGITEFSYHEKAHQKQIETGDKVLEKNLKDLESLKFEGREILNAFVFDDGVLPNLLRGIALQGGLESEDGLYLFSHDLLTLLKGGSVSKELLAERKTYYGCALIEDTFTVFSDTEAKTLWSEFHPKLDEVSEISGTVANKGYAKGRVIIAPMLTSPDAIREIIDRMEEGDILVAESTTPELMGLCKKAAAIVTDQGGMLSHAAVVSREMNKPCVIGTQIATQVLKDGNEVEVDANRGVITIISRNN